MRVMSFNILCGGSGKNYWTNRKETVISVIKKYNPDTFGLQEAHYRWMNALCAALTDYDYVGVGRANGKRLGEFSPVFYKKDKFDVVSKGNFWLSETPETAGSKGWDAACVRICSYAVLRDKKTKKEFAHFNTHLDHKGQTAMSEGAKLIAKRAGEVTSVPVIVTGDFNVMPSSEPYKRMIDAGFSDARNCAEMTDDCYTFHAFDIPIREGECAREIIDYIFEKGVKSVKEFRVITDKFGDKYPSDHYPVIADIEF